MRAEVVKVYERKEGTSDRGAWSMQRVELRDFDGDTIVALLTDRDPFLYQPGDLMILQAFVGDRGASGLYAHDDTFKDVTRRQIKVTKTGVIYRDENDTAPAPAPTPAQAPAPVQAPQAQPAPAPASAPAPADNAAMAAARREITRIANLHVLCVMAVERIEVPLIEQITSGPMSESQRQAAVASIFIKAERQGLVDKMPDKPFSPQDFK
jgi:hypothetical protein